MQLYTKLSNKFAGLFTLFPCLMHKVILYLKLPFICNYLLCKNLIIIIKDTSIHYFFCILSNIFNNFVPECLVWLRPGQQQQPIKEEIINFLVREKYLWNESMRFYQKRSQNLRENSKKINPCIRRK